MPAHTKSTIVGSSITIPITNGRLNLGTWQGIYLVNSAIMVEKEGLLPLLWIIGEC